MALRTFCGPVAFAVVNVAAAATTLAFVPSAIQELSALYPPLLRGDLSTCSTKTAVPTVASADRVRFEQRLHGTWDLRSRTVQGITVNSPDRVARMYFDFELPAGAPGVGSALLIDRSSAAADADVAPGRQAVAAFWRIGVTQPGKRTLAVTMRGEAVGSYTYARVRDLEDARFFQHRNVYVAIDKAAPSANAWDKIVLTEKSMTYVSCETRVVELYSKVSSRKPLVAGLSLQDSWERLKARSRVAAHMLSGERRTERGLR